MTSISEQNEGSFIVSLTNTVPNIKCNKNIHYSHKVLYMKTTALNSLLKGGVSKSFYKFQLNLIGNNSNEVVAAS